MEQIQNIKSLAKKIRARAKRLKTLDRDELALNAYAIAGLSKQLMSSLLAEKQQNTSKVKLMWEEK